MRNLDTKTPVTSTMDNVDHPPDEPQQGVWVVYDKILSGYVILFWEKGAADVEVSRLRIEAHNYWVNKYDGCACEVRGEIDDASRCTSNEFDIVAEYVIPRDH